MKPKNGIIFEIYIWVLAQTNIALNNQSTERGRSREIGY